MNFFAEVPVEGRCWANFFALAGAPVGCAVLLAPSTPPVVGVLRDTKPSHSVLLAREPAIASGNPTYRMLTVDYACGQRRPHAGHRAQV